MTTSDSIKLLRVRPMDRAARANRQIRELYNSKENCRNLAGTKAVMPELSLKCLEAIKCKFHYLEIEM
jgi:hypothetical protein